MVKVDGMDLKELMQKYPPSDYHHNVSVKAGPGGPRVYGEVIPKKTIKLENLIPNLMVILEKKELSSSLILLKCIVAVNETQVALKTLLIDARQEPVKTYEVVS